MATNTFVSPLITSTTHYKNETMTEYSGFGDSGEFGSPSSQFGQSQTSPASFGSSSQGGAQKRAMQSILPVTISQVLSAAPQVGDPNKFTIDGHTLTNLTFVGCVTEVDAQATHTSVKVTDGTGDVNVRLFSTDENSPTVRNKTYVRVIGNVRTFKGKGMSVVAYEVRPVTDFNEITFHMLQAIKTHLLNTQGSLDAVKQESRTVDGEVIAAPVVAGSGDLKSRILSAFDNAGVDGQLSRQDLITSLGEAAPAVNAMLSNMIDEGEIYSTCDEDHFSKC